jgi:hypothetical protein
MAMRVEALHSMNESIAYQMKCGATNEQLGGTIALAKVL